MNWLEGLLSDILPALKYLFQVILPQVLFPRADEVKDNPIINTPMQPQEPIQPPVVIAPPKYLWNNVPNIRHSMRVIGDEYGMTVHQKDLLCDICGCESGFDIHAKLINNPRSVDRGLFQWNNLYHPEITDAIAYDPEKATRLACKAILNRQAHQLWSASYHCWGTGGKYDIIM